MSLSIPALKRCRRVFGLNIEHTEVSGTTGTLQTSQNLISRGISAPTSNPSTGNFRRREGCSTPLLDTGESTLGNTHEQPGFDVLLWRAVVVGSRMGHFSPEIPGGIPGLDAGAAGTWLRWLLQPAAAICCESPPREPKTGLENLSRADLAAVTAGQVPVPQFTRGEGLC